MTDPNRKPNVGEQGEINEPQPDKDTVQVDAGTSSAIHEQGAYEEFDDHGENAAVNDPQRPRKARQVQTP